MAQEKNHGILKETIVHKQSTCAIKWNRRGIINYFANRLHDHREGGFL